MSRYNEEQSAVIALWVLAMKPNLVKGPKAPPVITQIVNSLGEQHSAESVLLHTHGFDRLFLNRPIRRSISKLQRSVSELFVELGIVENIYADN